MNKKELNMLLLLFPLPPKGGIPPKGGANAKG